MRVRGVWVAAAIQAIFLTAWLAMVPCPAAVAQGASAAAGVSAAPAAAAAQKKMTVAEKIAADKDKLDINTATAAQLKALPGMGDAYVARIIAGRPYTAKNQLVQRGVLPQTVYAGIAERIIAHRPKSAQ